MKAFNSQLSQLLDSGELDVLDPVMHIDIVPEDIDTGVKLENKSKNKLFYWLFEEEDLQNFVDIFMMFKENAETTNRLDGHLERLNQQLEDYIKVMHTKKINPIECILYASKVINKYFTNYKTSKKVMDVLVGKIIAEYSMDKEQVIKILSHILNTWSWIPQCKIVITAVGYIGEVDALFQQVIERFKEDMSYRKEYFYTLHRPGSIQYIEPIIDIIMSLDENRSIDVEIAKIIVEDFSIYGKEGFELLVKKKKLEKPRNLARKTINQIQGKSAYKNLLEEISTGKNIRDAAHHSIKSDENYKILLEGFDSNESLSEALYHSRASRWEVASKVIEKIEEGYLSDIQMSNALISLGMLASKGSSIAQNYLISAKETNFNSPESKMVARLLSGDLQEANNIAKWFSSKTQLEATSMQNALRQLKREKSTEIISKAIELEFFNSRDENREDFIQLLSNMGDMYDKRNGSMISSEVKNEISSMIRKRHTNILGESENMLITSIDILSNYYTPEFEELLFDIQHDTKASNKLKHHAMSILRNQDITAPE